MRKCNTTYHGFDENNNMVEIPMSTHNTTSSDGLEAEKLIDYKKDKMKALLPNNTLVKSNVKIGDNIFLGEYTTFKIIEIDDYSLEGLLTVELEQTLLSPDDNVSEQITSQQEQGIKPQTANISTNGIIGSDTIKIGNSSDYSLQSSVDVTWKITGQTLGASITSITKNSCQVSVEAKGRIVGNVITLKALDSKGNLLDKLDITITSII